MKHLNFFMVASALAISASAFAFDTPITTVPEGNVVRYTRSAEIYGLDLNWSMLEGKVAGSFSEVVYCDNNDVYLSNPSYFMPECGKVYIKGSKVGDELVFQLPQSVIVEEWDGEYYSYLVSMCDRTLSDGMYDYPQTTGTNELRLKIDGENLKWQGPTDGSVAFGVVDDGGYWAWAAEWNLDYKPMKEQPITLPENAQQFNWEMIYSGNATDCKVAFDNDDVYVGEFTEFAPDAWIKGKRDGNKVTFHKNQFMGLNEDYFQYVYFTPVDAKTNNGEIELSIADELVFDYDDAAKKLSSEGIFVINTNDEMVYYYEAFEQPVIRQPKSEVSSYVPATPQIIAFYDVDPTVLDDGSLTFIMPRVSVDDDVLDERNLYYRIYVDDDSEPWEFTTFDYQYLTANMVNVPYNFDDAWDFIVDGTYHLVYLKFHGAKRVGVQSMYQGSDKDYFSDIAWAENDAVNALNDNASNDTFFNINGIRVNNPQNGFYIKRSVKADGSVKTSKVVVK